MALAARRGLMRLCHRQACWPSHEHEGAAVDASCSPSTLSIPVLIARWLIGDGLLQCCAAALHALPNGHIAARQPPAACGPSVRHSVLPLLKPHPKTCTSASGFWARIQQPSLNEDWSPCRTPCPACAPPPVVASASPPTSPCRVIRYNRCGLALAPIGGECAMWRSLHEEVAHTAHSPPVRSPLLYLFCTS